MVLHVSTNQLKNCITNSAPETSNVPKPNLISYTLEYSLLFIAFFLYLSDIQTFLNKCLIFPVSELYVSIIILYIFFVLFYSKLLLKIIYIVAHIII